MAAIAWLAKLPVNAPAKEPANVIAAALRVAPGLRFTFTAPDSPAS